MKTSRSIGVILVVTGAVLAACTGPSTPLAPIPSVVPDPCAPDNIKSTVGAVDSLMQQFDDESTLASNVPRSQLAARIAALQSTRRQAQSNSAPACVAGLKRLQLTHMNTVIDTMLAFMSRGDQGAVGQGIEAGREQHDQYEVELARLLGITAAAVTPRPTLPAAPPPEGTPADGGQSVLVSSGFIALNPGPVPLTLRAVPATAGEDVATLPVGASATALGGTADGEWIQVVVPDHPYQTAWVLASLVQITVPKQ